MPLRPKIHVIRSGTVMETPLSRTRRLIEDLKWSLNQRLNNTEGVVAVIDELAAILMAFIPPEAATELVGNFTFRHNGEGTWVLSHGSCQATCVPFSLSSDEKDDVSVKQFTHSLEQGWLDYVLGALAFETVH